MDEEIVYSPNKYRETEGIKGRNDSDGFGQLRSGKWLRKDHSADDRGRKSLAEICFCAATVVSGIRRLCTDKRFLGEPGACPDTADSVVESFDRPGTDQSFHPDYPGSQHTTWETGYSCERI